MIAYQTAFGLNVTVQAAALIWLALPWLRSFVPIAAPDIQVNRAPAMAEESIPSPLRQSIGEALERYVG